MFLAFRRQGFKAATTNMLKNVKKTMLKQVKASVMTMSHQIDNTSRVIEIIKRAKFKF